MQQQFATTPAAQPEGATPAAEPTGQPATPPVAPKLPIPDTVDPVLSYILSLKRPDAGPTEKEFVTTWLPQQIASMGYAPMWKSENLVAVVPLPGQEGLPPTLFSCHVDTVHQTSGTQALAYDANKGLIYLDGDIKTHECLGADDGVGVWIMLRMMAARVPGAYVFHRAEERGCAGSRRMAREHPDWLKKFSHAVAFDRPNNFEVITHQQAGRRLASDTFGKAVASALNNLSGGTFHYELSNRGAVTDTAMYGALIPECINLGVGYKWQHTGNEELDYAHAHALMEVCKVVNWAGLPVERTPSDERPGQNYGYVPGAYGGYAGSTWRGSQGGQASMFPKTTAREFGGPNPVGGKGKGKGKGKPGARLSQVSGARPQTPDLPLADEIEDMTMPDLAAVIEAAPMQAARWMAELVAELRAAEARFKSLRAAWLTTEELSDDGPGGYFGR